MLPVGRGNPPVSDVQAEQVVGITCRRSEPVVERRGEFRIETGIQALVVVKELEIVQQAGIGPDFTKVQAFSSGSVAADDVGIIAALFQGVAEPYNLLAPSHLRLE